MEHLPKSLEHSGALDIKRQLENIIGGNILDVATQSGSFIQTLMDFLSDYVSFTAIDITSKEWNHSRFTDKPVTFLQMNAEILEFKNSTFDTVTISHSLHHLTSVEKVLTEMKRVLRPNGYFILQEMFSDKPQTQAQRTDVYSHHWGAKIDTLFGIPHYSTLSKDDIKQYISDLGLETEAMIESTHPVKCLLCDDKFKCSNPKNPSIIKFALKEIKENKAKLQKGIAEGKIIESTYVNNLILEGEMIKNRIKMYGSASASHLIFIGRKS